MDHRTTPSFIEDNQITTVPSYRPHLETNMALSSLSHAKDEKPAGETEHIDEVSETVKEAAESLVYDAEEEKKAVRKLDLFMITT